MRLTHGRTEIELHLLKEGRGTAALLLHELGGSHADLNNVAFDGWQGAVYALDFAGHGASAHVAGNGYSPEYFLADADIAMSAAGVEAKDEFVVIGAGIGGYVALMLAAARSERVAAALVLPGRGLAGGGLVPDFGKPAYQGLDAWEAEIADLASHYQPGTDPMVSACERDLRPAPYVEELAAGVRRLLLSDTVATSDEVPSWWSLAMNAPGYESIDAQLDDSFDNALSALQGDGNEENAA
ncbi:MAG: pimeloyl-ACP methyl ester carboxylesterase [Myxococcota bacterium]|jgi:pimeloyl-ACP methyl ester carboxylesterase